MQIAAEIFAAGAAAYAERPSKAALRTRKWREKNRHQSVTGDATGDENESVTNRHKPSQGVTGDKVPRENKNIRSSRRGTRIGDDWSPSPPERELAKQEGFSDSEIDREALRFRDYWTAASGAKAVKHDWAATWRNWVRNAADKLGRAPKIPATATISSGKQKYYAPADSPQLFAWDAFTRQSTGKNLPRDRNGGWRVESEWPPGYVKPDTELIAFEIPKLKSVS